MTRSAHPSTPRLVSILIVVGMFATSCSDIPKSLSSVALTADSDAVFQVARDVSIRVEPGDLQGPARLATHRSNLDPPKVSWYEPIGDPVEVDFSEALAAPVTLDFAPAKRPSSDRVPMLWRHDSDLGWYPIAIGTETESASAERMFFSPFSWGWAKVKAAADAVSAGTRKVLGDRSDALTCSGPPEWFELSPPGQDVVHSCATRNVEQGAGRERGEVQIRNNRGYIVEVVPPPGVAYTWVDGQSDAIRGLVRAATRRDSILLSPGQLMTVGFTQPPDTGEVKSIRVGPSAIALVSSALVQAASDSDSAVGVYAVLADCATLPVPLDLNPGVGSVKELGQKAVGCLTDLLANPKRLQALAFSVVAARAGVDPTAVALDKGLAVKADKLVGTLKVLGWAVTAVTIGSKVIDLVADSYVRAEVGEVDSMSPLVSMRSVRRGQVVTPPTSTVGKTPLTEASLLSAPVPSLCQHPPGVLVNGSLPGVPAQQGGVSILAKTIRDNPGVVFGDLTNDRTDDAAVTISCSQGGVGWPNPILVYTTGPTLLATINLPDIVPAWNARANVQKVQIVDGKLLVDWLTGAEGDIGGGSTLEVSARLRLDGSKVVVEQLTKYEEGPVMDQLLAAINAGNMANALKVADASVVDDLMAWSKKYGRLASAGCYGALRPGMLTPPMTTGRYCLVDGSGQPPPAYVGFGKVDRQKEYRATKWAIAQLAPTTPLSPPCAVTGKAGTYVVSNLRGTVACNTATQVWAAYEGAGGPGDYKFDLVGSWSCGLPDSDKRGVVAQCRNNSMGIIFEVSKS